MENPHDSRRDFLRKGIAAGAVAASVGTRGEAHAAEASPNEMDEMDMIVNNIFEYDSLGKVAVEAIKNFAGDERRAEHLLNKIIRAEIMMGIHAVASSKKISILEAMATVEFVTHTYAKIRDHKTDGVRTFPGNEINHVRTILMQIVYHTALYNRVKKQGRSA